MHLSTQETTDISALIEPYRGELLLHCYRLLGSLHDAEDMVQETMLRAWKHFETFKGQSLLRTWLYQIATNVCLSALKKRVPRSMPTVAYPEASLSDPVGPRMSEPIWLEPFPDSWLVEATENPEARYSRYESISLAFLTALQLLPPRQRAILILSDVLDWRAQEIGDLLETTVSAVNSALRRARVTLEKNYHTTTVETERVHEEDATTNELLARYIHAWETDDVVGLVALLKEDAILSMPPISSWYRGHEAIQAILAMRIGMHGRWRLYPTRANGLPAFAVYHESGAGQRVLQAFSVQVIRIDDKHVPGQIAEVTAFLGASFVTAFGFPLEIPL
jgi:RNA polymerase sigma-70 factor (ECF subfamily)